MPPIPVKKSPTMPAPPANQASTQKVTFESVQPFAANRIVVYGTGGIGKTTLCLKLPGKTAFFDRDDSLGKLAVPSNVVKPRNADGTPIAGWGDVRACLRRSGWESINNIVLDSGSQLEKDCAAYILRTVKTEKNAVATSMESYGWGKGYRFFYEEFMLLLSDLDRHFREGRNVIMICHEISANVPNPDGEDWIRYEPDLYQTDKVSIRAKVKNWADHVLFIGYDVAVNEDGKAKGQGTRTLYPRERPHFMAKSRTCSEPIQISDADYNPWPEIIG